jgi:hypothetical protein
MLKGRRYCWKFGKRRFAQFSTDSWPILKNTNFSQVDWVCCEMMYLVTEYIHHITSHLVYFWLYLDHIDTLSLIQCDYNSCIYLNNHDDTIVQLQTHSALRYCFKQISIIYYKKFSRTDYRFWLSIFWKLLIIFQYCNNLPIILIWERSPY